MKSRQFKYIALVLLFLSANFHPLFAQSKDDGEMSGYERLERLRELKDSVQEALASENYKAAAKYYRRMAQLEQDRSHAAHYMLESADAMMLARKPYKAKEAYESLLKSYPLFIPYEHVVGQLRKLAGWLVDGDGTFLGIRDKDTSVEVYEMIIREAPADQVTDQDRLRLAELLIQLDRREEAIVVYQDLLKKDQQNWDVHAKLALLWKELSKSGDGDGSKLRAAVREAKIVIYGNPQHPSTAELRRLRDEALAEEANRLLAKAKFYLVRSHKRVAAARRYLHDIIVKYPGSQAAEEAKKLLETNQELKRLEASSDVTDSNLQSSQKPFTAPKASQDTDEDARQARQELKQAEQRKQAALQREKDRRENSRKAADLADKQQVRRENDELDRMEKARQKAEKKLLNQPVAAPGPEEARPQEEKKVRLELEESAEEKAERLEAERKKLQKQEDNAKLEARQVDLDMEYIKEMMSAEKKMRKEFNDLQKEEEKKKHKREEIIQKEQRKLIEKAVREGN